MTSRYFVPSPATGRVQLTGDEARHLRRVMRAKPGDVVVLFDGSGREFSAHVESIARDGVHLTITSSRVVDRELPFRLTLGVSLPKTPRQRWLVEKLVELGVSRLAALQTRRGVAPWSAAAQRRWERVVIEASKQCGRNELMAIEGPVTWETFIGRGPAADRSVAAHPSGAPFVSRPLEPGDAGSEKPEMLIAVGPEGGFTDEEIQLAQDAGWEITDLGPRMLRVETAAVTLAGWAALAGVSARDD